MQTYIVQQGDTLYGISKQFGISVEEIMSENNLTSASIKPSQVLKIPTVTTTARYIVKSGDTLYSIANLYNTTVAELRRINNLESNLLTIGQQLMVPVNEETGSGVVVYTVKSGDSLYAIAKKYNTTVEEIKELNNLTSDLLSIGQQLKISTEVSSPSTNEYQLYIVKSGDTLYKIASEYGMSVDELIDVNNLETTVLTIGQVLKVKTKYDSQIPLGSECYGSGYVEPTYVTYTVKKGDSLYIIAKKYNTTVDDLIHLNELKSNNLSIGQVLKIKEVIE